MVAEGEDCRDEMRVSSTSEAWDASRSAGQDRDLVPRRQGGRGKATRTLGPHTQPSQIPLDAARDMPASRGEKGELSERRCRLAAV